MRQIVGIQRDIVNTILSLGNEIHNFDFVKPGSFANSKS